MQSLNTRVKKDKRKLKGRTIVKSFDIGVNDLCPCKSGKKFKKCCLLTKVKKTTAYKYKDANNK